MKTIMIVVGAMLAGVIVGYVIFVSLNSSMNNDTINGSLNGFKQNYVVPKKLSPSESFNTQSFQQKPLKID